MQRQLHRSDISLSTKRKRELEIASPLHDPHKLLCRDESGRNGGLIVVFNGRNAMNLQQSHLHLKRYRLRLVCEEAAASLFTLEEDTYHVDTVTHCASQNAQIIK